MASEDPIEKAIKALPWQPYLYGQIVMDYAAYQQERSKLPPQAQQRIANGCKLIIKDGITGEDRITGGWAHLTQCESNLEPSAKVLIDKDDLRELVIHKNERFLRMYIEAVKKDADYMTSLHLLHTLSSFSCWVKRGEGGDAVYTINREELEDQLAQLPPKEKARCTEELKAPWVSNYASEPPSDTVTAHPILISEIGFVERGIRDKIARKKATAAYKYQPIAGDSYTRDNMRLGLDAAGQRGPSAQVEAINELKRREALDRWKDI